MTTKTHFKTGMLQVCLSCYVQMEMFHNYDVHMCECGTGIKLSKGRSGKASPKNKGGSLSLNFCDFAGDVPDDTFQSGFEFFLKTPGSKDLSLSKLLFFQSYRAAKNFVERVPS